MATTRPWSLLPLLLLFAACGALDGGDDDDDGGSTDLIEDARAGCDTTASAWDDLFYFEAETTNDTSVVKVDVYVGNGFTGTVRLDERGSGYWYGEAWADDLDADCDDWSRMYFEVTATGGGETDTVSIEP